MDLMSDPRWRRFNDSDSPCACCGRVFQGVFDLASDHPDPWPHGSLRDSGLDDLKVGEDRLTADLCWIGPHRFVRALVQLPIKGSDQVFAFGAWGSVNADNFERYVASDGFEGCFAWLMNRLAGFEFTDWPPCNLMPGEAGMRPVLEVHDGTHELAALQDDGITFDQLLDIYAAAGNDIRPHLLDA